MKTTLLVCMCCLACSAFAQQKKYVFGLQAGVNFTSLSVSGLPADVSHGNKSIVSYQGGATVAYTLSDHFLLQSGLFITGKGGEQTYQFDRSVQHIEVARPSTPITIEKAMSINPRSPSIQAAVLPDEAERAANDEMEVRTTLLYLELPLRAVYRIPIKQSGLEIGAGPYYAYALRGEIEKTAAFQSEGRHETASAGKVNFGNSETDDVHRHDVGVSFSLGYHLKNGLGISGEYGLGLYNIAADPSNGKLRNRLFSVCIGYRFN